MKLYAIRPILVRGYVIAEGGSFEPDNDAHGRELVEAGLASENPKDTGEARESKKAKASSNG